MASTICASAPRYYATHVGPGKYDWDFSDQTFVALNELEITRRFPHLRFYTPINEIFIVALFSAAYGWWNERLSSDRAFVTALKHLCQANILAMRAILDVRPDSVFVQSESSEYFHAESPRALARAEFLNERRLLALDLTYGVPVSALMYQYLLDSGMTREEYEWFGRNQVKANCVMGNDYDIRQDGVNIIGFTWYSLTDQVDWDTALREENGRVNPCGLVDLDRQLRPVGRAYAQLIADWRSHMILGGRVAF